MAIRQSWRYEKDFFGKRHRKYFLENIYGADIADMKTFRALKTKLGKDYLLFFEGLDRSYQRGEFKKLAKESIAIVHATTALLDHMIDTGSITDESVGAVATNIGNLNASRDFFVGKSEEVKALKGRMEQVEAETGVSPAALSVSEEVVTTGAKREKKKLKEGVVPFLGRTLPRTVSLGKELATSVAAALGPVYPLAQMAGGAAADIFSLGRGISQKLGERKEQKMATSLQPLAHGLPASALQGLGQARGMGPILPRVVEQRKKTGQATLMEFFNKGAFRAKWTKELLKNMKKTGSGKGFGLGGLASKFMGLGAALLPLLGTTGLIAGLGLVSVGAGTTGLIAGLGLVSVGATDRLSKLGSKLSELGEVTANVRKTLQTQAELQRKFNDRIRVSLGEKLRDALKRGDEKARKEAVEAIKQSELIRVREENQKIGIYQDWKAGVGSLFGGRDRKKAIILPLSGEVTKIEQGRRDRNRELSTSPTSPGSPRGEDIVGQINKLSSAIDALTKKLGKDGQVQATIKERSIGDPFDSSDVLLNKYVEADLSLE